MNSIYLWIFEKDNSFTIEISDESRNFSEEWTKKFPDQKAFVVEVHLKINGELVNKSLQFIGVDGWRNFVPCPKTSTAFDERYFFWDRNSLEYKVFERIGFLDSMYRNIEEFGKRCGVLIK
jgi:hypothetical protein